MDRDNVRSPWKTGSEREMLKMVLMTTPSHCLVAFRAICRYCFAKPGNRIFRAVSRPLVNAASTVPMSGPR